MSAGERLPNRCRRACRLHAAAERAGHRSCRSRRGSVHRLHSALLIADDNLVTGFDAFYAAHVDGGIPLGRLYGQARAGHTQQIIGLGSQGSPGRDLDVRKSGNIGGVLAHGPSGKVHLLIGSVVKLDEAVGDAEFVNFHGFGATHLQSAGLLVTFPGSHGFQVSVEGGAAGSDVKFGHYHLSRLYRVGNGLGGRCLPSLGCLKGQCEAFDGGVRGIHKADHGLGGTAGGKGLDIGGTAVVQGREYLHGRHAVTRSHHVGLDGLIHFLGGEGAGGGHGTFIEGTGRAVGVVAAVAQQDGALLAHRVIAAARVLDAAAVVVDFQLSLLGVAAHRAPVVRLAVGHGRNKTPVHAVQAAAVFVVGVRIHAAHQVVLLVGHNPRSIAFAIVPAPGIAEVSGFHGAVTVVAAVRLGITVVEAAAGIVMLAAEHPVLALGLVVHGRTGGVVQPQAHTRSDEDAIDFVTHHVHRRPVGHGYIVVAAHSRAAETAARGLIQMVPLAGLVVKHRNPAVGVLAEGILRRRIGISAGVRGGSFHYADIQGLAVGLAHNLVQGTVVGSIQGTGGAVGRHARCSAAFIHVTRPFRALERGKLLAR